LSSFSKAGHLVSSLNKSDFKILKVFASSLKTRQFLNLSTLSQYSNLNQRLVEHHLERLVKSGLVGKSNIGFTLLVTGLDIYVLKILSNRNTITSIGPQIGIGKEAEIYLAHDSQEKDKILKMFRLGRSSFKQIKRKRDISTSTSSWLLLNIQTAKREYDILNYLRQSSTSFPTPLYRSFHCIVMEPQAIKVDTINANVVLLRDVKNILKFFSKKYKIETDVGNTINHIKGI
jgi:RIO kinase 2